MRGTGAFWAWDHAFSAIGLGVIEDVRDLVALRSFRVQMSRRANLDAPKILNHTMAQKIEKDTVPRRLCQGRVRCPPRGASRRRSPPGLYQARSAESRVAYLPNRPAPPWAVLLDWEHLIEGASWDTCNIPHCRLLAAECPPFGTSVTIREESRIFLRIMSLDHFPDP